MDTRHKRGVLCFCPVIRISNPRPHKKFASPKVAARSAVGLGSNPDTPTKNKGLSKCGVHKTVNIVVSKPDFKLYTWSQVLAFTEREPCMNGEKFVKYKKFYEDRAYQGRKDHRHLF